MGEVTKRDFLCCFDGSRDNYEAAIALAEVGRLSMLLTDCYMGSPILRPLARVLTKASVPRYRVDLPASLVQSCPSSLLVRRSRLARNMLGSAQEVLARRFADVAKGSSDNLFAYAGYGRKAFDPSERHRRKVLFQYHPQRIYEREAFEASGLKMNSTADDPDDLGNIKELNAADEIICASSFTRRSIERVLGKEKPITVAPYGSNICVSPQDVVRRRQLFARPTGGVRMLLSLIHI